MKPILIAGIGNIFLGDDGFGCEVARELSHRNLPKNVQVIDFGIRSYDFAYALAGDYEAVIVADAVPRGLPAGTVSLIEPDLDEIRHFEDATPDGHGMNPVAAIQHAWRVGTITGKVLIVGCEPCTFGNDAGDIALSEPVRNAIPTAVETIQSLLECLTQRRTENNPGFVPV